MNRTRIEWCDYTWNPVTGCSEVSEGCANCYAREMSRRFGWEWGRPVFHLGRMTEPQAVKRPGRVFVCSMGDLGHGGLTDTQRRFVRLSMGRAPWHQYIVLTKRPGEWLKLMPASCWVGVTGETEKLLAERWQELENHAGERLKFVSLEPLLECVDVSGVLDSVDWVIAGPETGRGARPCEDEWIDAIAEDCRRAGVPFFDKRKKAWVRREWPG